MTTDTKINIYDALYYFLLFILHAAPGDYTSLSNASLTYQIGDPNGTILCLDIDIYDDEIVEYVEYFSVILSSLLEPVYFEPIQEANVSIYDNDRKYILSSPFIHVCM